MVDDLGHELWHSSLIAAMSLRPFDLDYQPPVAANFLDRLPNP
jgi:hypothetical protein